jgi:hypothetical protein
MGNGMSKQDSFWFVAGADFYDFDDDNKVFLDN